MMKYEILDEDGYYSDPGVNSVSEISEERYDYAYETLFAEIDKSRYSIRVSGSLEEADFSMSRWVDPTDNLSIVVLNDLTCYRDLVGICYEVLKSLGPSYTISIDDYPELVTVEASGRVVGTGDEGKLSKYGFNNC